MTAKLFLAPDLADAAVGGEVTLDGPEARHAATVQRLAPGEVLDLADGRGRRVRGTVARVLGKDELVVTVDEVRDEPAPSVELVLVQALAKGGRDEQAVETAVEVGVDAVVPWRAQRCVSVWQGPKVDKGRARWEATVAAATKQSRRAFRAPVLDMLTTSQLADWTREVVAGGGSVLVLHEEASYTLGQAAVPVSRPRTGDEVEDDREAGERAPRIAVVVGPEGGIGAEETQELVAAGAQAVRLGPHVLRTSTAGPVALAVLAQQLGRWS